MHTMRSVSGAERRKELLYSSVNAVGFDAPMPPRRAGKARRSRSSSFNASRPVIYSGDELLTDSVFDRL